MSDHVLMILGHGFGGMFWIIMERMFVFSINMMQFEEDDMGRVGQDMIEAIVWLMQERRLWILFESEFVVYFVRVFGVWFMKLESLLSVQNYLYKIGWLWSTVGSGILDVEYERYWGLVVSFLSCKV